jgi:transposase
VARERVRVLAAEGFERGEKNTDIAKDLRVSLRSVERWRRAWREKGIAGLHCAGPAKRPKVSTEQFAVLKQELLRGAVSAERALDPVPGERADQPYGRARLAP